MDSLIFDLQIVFYFQLFLSANVRHRYSYNKKIKIDTCLYISKVAVKTRINISGMLFCCDKNQVRYDKLNCASGNGNLSTVL